MNKLQINPNSTPYVKWLGDNEVPLFIIDDLFVNPSAVRDSAFSKSFPSSKAYYPGRHQPLSQEDESVKAFCFFIAEILSYATGKNINGEAVSTDFSILTTAENSLLNMQGQPHIDGTPMLGVVYLNDKDFGGTVFFRNKETGSMKVVTEKEKAHYERVSNSNTSLAKPSLKYVTDTTEEWEKIEVVEGINNRLVIWPGNVFHSIEVKVDPSLGATNEKRLTQRVIVNALD